MFYHPQSRQTFNSDDFLLDETRASGPSFNIHYNGGLYFNSFQQLNHDLKPSKFAPETTIIVKSTQQPGKIISIPDKSDDIYTIQLESGDIMQYQEDDIDFPPLPPNKHDFQIPTWIKDGCNATLYLKDMSDPKHGTLHLDTTQQEWSFKPGRRLKNTHVPLPDFKSQVHTLIKD